MARGGKGDFGLEGIFDNVRDGLVLVRFPAREVVLFNRSASEMCGIPMDEAIGRRLERLLPDPAVVATAKKSSERPVGEWPGHDQTVLQTQTAKRKGKSTEVEIHFCRVDDVGTGGPLVLLVVRPRPEADLRAALEHGEQARRRVSILEAEAREHALLFSEAAHEFKTPLTVLALQAQLLRAALRKADPAHERTLEIINANVHRLVLLSQDLVDLARADAGRLVVRDDLIDLVWLLRDEVESFQPLALQEGVHIALLAPREPVSIRGEPGRLLQVLGNFLANAVKFTPRGGRITVELVAEDGVASVRVHDNGRGMDAEDQERLFRPFVRVDSPDQPKKPGTGLGLYLSKRIIEAHGGQVGCFSAGRGRGMTFWFDLALAEPPTAASEPRSRARQAAPGHWSRAAKEAAPRRVSKQVQDSA